MFAGERRRADLQSLQPPADRRDAIGVALQCARLAPGALGGTPQFVLQASSQSAKVADGLLLGRRVGRHQPGLLGHVLVCVIDRDELPQAPRRSGAGSASTRPPNAATVC